ncbi:MAG TPA: bifunctional phosphoribosylaminoimidazolecarboxamide formyltransferase/IMP cyclohydrolase [Candidatus Eremiobacteraceae bacterium]|nr:bifunctional phosphoribosylaminoimidazolecarboxamide formyltransferase/IMP cyclohydrolase [Candidatus Eremiobacteraceae bacterium]
MALAAALLSVSDRTGIESLASALHDNGYSLYGTSGTAEHLRAAGLACEDVGTLTGFPPLCDGRVKTLHPKIFAGILADRTRAQHLADLAQYDVPSFAVVAVNLYPFEQTVQRRGASEAEIVEQIDIGGVTLLRAAAKNYAHVAVLSDPDQYAGFIESLARGGSSLEERRTWAGAAFARCERYDTAIAAHFSGASSPLDLPETLHMSLTRAAQLRYGENPQTRAAFYLGRPDMPLPKQLWGKTLSYNNLLDLDSCLRLLAPIESPVGFPAGIARHAVAAAIVKHTVPCGLAARANVHDAVVAALGADPISAFGGIVACGAEVDEATAAVLASRFLEVIAAPSFSPAALERLQKKKNLRLLQFDSTLPSALLEAGKVRSALGGILIEHPDPSAPADSWTVMTQISPTREHWRDLLFAFGAVRQVKSNAAVVVSDEVTLGVCGGQTNRVAAVELACERAGDGVRGAVLATDGFFPFADGLEAAIRAGISAVIAPGGSVRDAEVIEAARNADIALVFATRRYFLH